MCEFNGVAEPTREGEGDAELAFARKFIAAAKKANIYISRVEYVGHTRDYTEWAEAEDLLRGFFRDFRAECVGRYKDLEEAALEVATAQCGMLGCRLDDLREALSALPDQGVAPKDKPRPSDEELGRTVAAWLRDELCIRDVDLAGEEYRAFGQFIRAKLEGA